MERRIQVCGLCGQIRIVQAEYCSECGYGGTWKNHPKPCTCTYATSGNRDTLETVDAKCFHHGNKRKK